MIFFNTTTYGATQPTAHTSFYNNFLFLIKKHYKNCVISVNEVVWENDVLFVIDKKSGIRFNIDATNSVFIITSKKAFEPILMEYGIVADSYSLSKELCGNRFSLAYFLNKNKVNIPKFSLSTPLKPPFVIKDLKMSSTNKYLAKKSSDIEGLVKKIRLPYFCQEYIAEKEGFQVDYRVYLFLNIPFAVSIRFNPTINTFTTKHQSLLEIPLLHNVSLKKINIGKCLEWVNSESSARYYNEDYKFVKPSRTDLVKISELFEQESIASDHRLAVKGINEKIYKTAIDASTVCRIGFCVVNLVRDGKDFKVLDINTDIDGSLLANRLGTSSLSSYLFSTLEHKGILK